MHKPTTCPDTTNELHSISRKECNQILSTLVWDTRLALIVREVLRALLRVTYDYYRARQDFILVTPGLIHRNSLSCITALVGHFETKISMRIQTGNLKSFAGTTEYIYIYIYTGCPRRNVPDFGRVFLKLKYTDITQNTYVQS